MAVRYGIGSLFLGLCALGVGYVAFVDERVVEALWPTEAGLDGTVDQSAQDETEPDQAGVVERAQGVTGSAARRMDDFGAGPGGSVVTAPLKNRHRQAYSGQSMPGGGGSSAKGSEMVDAATGAAESELAMIEGADTDSTEAGKAGDGDSVSKPGYRVVERTPETADPEGGGTSTAPSFDIVRIDPEGNAVIAGRAAPLADVEVKIGDRVVDRIKASPGGEWVSIPVEPLASGDQELSLSASADQGAPVVSSQIVVVSIPERSERRSDGANQSVAVILDKAKGGDGRILQAPDALRSDSDLSLRIVDYDDRGAIRLSGDAPPGVPVRIYIDNEPTALVIGDSKGQWVTTLDQNLPGGDYTLRLDQLDTRGQTISRIETPLTRVTTPPVEGTAKVDYVVVQPGNSLWRIARRLSGSGFNYVYIYEANQAQIRDPDVIYPGQVFEVPADSGIAG